MLTIEQLNEIKQVCEENPDCDYVMKCIEFIKMHIKEVKDEKIIKMANETIKYLEGFK